MTTQASTLCILIYVGGIDIQTSCDLQKSTFFLVLCVFVYLVSVYVPYCFCQAGRSHFFIVYLQATQAEKCF